MVVFYSYVKLEITLRPLICMCLIHACLMSMGLACMLWMLYVVAQVR